MLMTAAAQECLGEVMVILVEDDEMMAETTLYMLELEYPGMPIRHCRTVREAKQALQSLDGQTIVILDGELPDGTSMQLMELLNDLGHTLAYVIVTSGRKELANQLMACGGDERLEKPFSPSALLASIERGRGILLN